MEPDIDQWTTLTYGVLPGKERFLENFARLVPRGRYRVTNCPRVGTLTYSAEELWAEILHQMQLYEDEEDDAAGDWVSSVLFTLGFEWI